MTQPITKPQIPFNDLDAQRVRLGSALEDAVLAVMRHGRYIMGPEVKQFEADLGAFCGAKEVVSCGNGTDALGLVLAALDVGPGQAVLCPSFTFAATAEAIARTGASPVFVDVHAETFNMDARSFAAGIVRARKEGLKPVGVIPVDLFGQPADYDAILPIAEDNKLWVLCDSAQSFGATYKGRKVGDIGLATATSFFPAKPLGCYGDGGAVMTDDHELAETIRSLRVHGGHRSNKYENVLIGTNSRLDTIQAAVLIEKLKIFADEIVARDRVAVRYAEALADTTAIVPMVIPGATSVWASYSLRILGGRRDAVATQLKDKGIPTAIYYAKPLHQQTAYRGFPVAGNGLPVSEAVVDEVLNIPMHPYLDPHTQDLIIDAVKTAVR